MLQLRNDSATPNADAGTRRGANVLEFINLEISGVIEIRPVRHGDERGYFSEVFRADHFCREARDVEFVQENESLSAQAGTVRGLHFQTSPFAQGKLVRCIAGSIFDVAVDLRRDSPSYAKWVGLTLSAAQGNQLWVPPGFAHGFCTLEPDCLVSYKVTSYYAPEADKGVAWDDPDIGVAWPDLADPETLSAKDRKQPALADLPHLFTMKD